MLRVGPGRFGNRSPSAMKTAMDKSTKDQHADLFRDLCENAHDLIQSVAPDGRFLYVNRTWLETLGYRREDVERLTVFDIVHPDSLDHCRRKFGELLDGKETAHIEATFVAKDGTKIPVEGGAGCRFVNGQPVSTRGIFRDMRETYRTRREFDRLFHLSLDLMCVAGTDGLFRHVNPAFERMLGCTEEELRHRSFMEFVHPDDVGATEAAVERLAQGLPVVDFENRYRAHNGDYRWIAWRSAPVPEDGLIYAVARDVTEGKRIQALMTRQAEELARSNADLEMFAYAASHDLRAPLRAIANLSEWVAEDLGKEIPENVSQHIDELRSRVRALDSLISDLLSYSRAGREPGDTTRVNVPGLVSDLHFLIDPPEGFEVVAGPGLPTFETVKSPLEQVLRNLIENAIKHHDRETGRVVVSATDAGEFYEFAVADDGPGIRAENREKIFEAFERLPSVRSRAGSGLGLALVRRIVQMFQGRVWVEDAKPRGTVFRFTWPKQMGGS